MNTNSKNSGDKDSDNQANNNNFWKQLLYQQTVSQETSFKPPDFNEYNNEQQHQDCVRLIQKLSLKSFQRLHSQPQSPSHTQTQSNPITQIPKDVNISTVQNDNIEVYEASSSEESKYEKMYIKQLVKHSKKIRKNKYDTFKLRLISPESPLTIFSKLYKNVNIELKEKSFNNYTIFNASIEIDGQVYTGDHISKIQAKQKACQKFLHKMLERKLSDQSQQEESFKIFKTENTINTPTTSQNLPHDDFPWTHFASLAMYNSVMNSSSSMHKQINDNNIPKFRDVKQFPNNPKDYNPVQLLYYMIPRIQFTMDTVCFNRPQIFEVKCEIKSEKFSGRGSSKKEAKRECAIAAINFFWNFDFHTINHY